MSPSAPSTLLDDGLFVPSWSHGDEQVPRRFSVNSAGAFPTARERRLELATERSPDAAIQRARRCALGEGRLQVVDVGVVAALYGRCPYRQRI